ncbi:hypothetical protein BDQ94DRAFT_151773 [Aspergillus welwitschiae]|uniref:Uncharacterized protein n=1 Tax=Aspergillus welwitschiae TaxID=1341132 RepID=A0A3F3PPC7_9EURO|nr:hypothetical protein BDQ94DRAFT_151773 [Aspergillus welwitschiae]RDH28703.1 hypothetical protein BDQ94DRAFT_151773 [Aspergillus welwitschiae]
MAARVGTHSHGPMVLLPENVASQHGHKTSISATLISEGGRRHSQCAGGGCDRQRERIARLTSCNFLTCPPLDRHSWQAGNFSPLLLPHEEVIDCLDK